MPNAYREITNIKQNKLFSNIFSSLLLFLIEPFADL